jgi:uncharacterized repeat protein (TIGR01451 family)
VRKEGPRTLQAGQKAGFTIRVRNTGGTVLRNVKVVDRYEQGLQPTDASAGYKIVAGEMTWTFDTLQPGQEQRLEVAAKAVAGVARACSRARVSADGGLIEITGGAATPPAAPEPGAATPMPAGPMLPPPPAEPGRPVAPAEPGGLKVELLETQEEVSVGRNASYDVRITNTRKTSDFQVVVSLTAPPGTTPLADRAMGPTRATVTGQVLRFGAVAEIRPNEVLTFHIPVRGDRAGRMRMEVTVTSRAETQPIVASEETDFFSGN